MTPNALLRRIVLPFAILLLGSGDLGAQADVFAPGKSHARPGLDTLLVTLDAQPRWRDYVLGCASLGLSADFYLLGAPTSADAGAGLTSRIYGSWVFDDRPDSPAEALLGAELHLGWWFDRGILTTGGSSTRPAMIAVVADAYTLPRDDGDTEGIEVGVQLAGVDIDWHLQERDPLLTVGVYRDFGRFDAFRVALDTEVGLWIPNVAPEGFREVGAWIDAGGSWMEEAGFAWRAGLGVGLGRGSLTYSVKGGVADPHNTGLRPWAQMAVRFWPDSADLPLPSGG